MQEAVEDKQYFVSFGRCIICGMRLYSSNAPRCDWCEDVRLHQIVDSLLERLNQYLEEHEPSNPRVDSALAFVADIGQLSTKHPYFSSLRKILTLLMERGVVDGEFDAQKIWGPNLLMDARKLLPLFSRTGLCTFRVDTKSSKITIEMKGKSIMKRAHSWLQTEPGRNETASFLMGYTFLQAIQETMQALDKEGKLPLNEGVARIYPTEYSDKGEAVGLRLPKGITSVLAFLLGSWARGWNEFDEFTLHTFLRNRGVGGREYDAALALLSQTVPGISHGIVDYEVYTQGGTPVKRFKYSESVRRLRDELRSRERPRS